MASVHTPPVLTPFDAFWKPQTSTGTPTQSPGGMTTAQPPSSTPIQHPVITAAQNPGGGTPTQSPADIMPVPSPRRTPAPVIPPIHHPGGASAAPTPPGTTPAESALQAAAQTIEKLLVEGEITDMPGKADLGTPCLTPTPYVIIPTPSPTGGGITKRFSSRFKFPPVSSIGHTPGDCASLAMRALAAQNRVKFTEQVLVLSSEGRSSGKGRHRNSALAGRPGTPFPTPKKCHDGDPGGTPTAVQGEAPPVDLKGSSSAVTPSVMPPGERVWNWLSPENEDSGPGHSPRITKLRAQLQTLVPTVLVTPATMTSASFDSFTPSFDSFATSPSPHQQTFDFISPGILLEPPDPSPVVSDMSSGNGGSDVSTAASWIPTPTSVVNDDVIEVQALMLPSPGLAVQDHVSTPGRSERTTSGYESGGGPEVHLNVSGVSGRSQNPSGLRGPPPVSPSSYVRPRSPEPCLSDSGIQSATGSSPKSAPEVVLNGSRQLPMYSTGVKVIKTMLLALANFTTALCLSILGPTLPGLMTSHGMGLTSASVLVTSRSGGGLLGVFILHRIFDNVTPYMSFTLALLVSGGIMTGYPFITTGVGLNVASFISGATLAFLFCASGAVCLHIWSRDYVKGMTVTQLMLSVGLVVGPLLSRPLMDPGLFGGGGNLNYSMSSAGQNNAVITNNGLQIDNMAVMVDSVIDPSAYNIGSNSVSNKNSGINSTIIISLPNETKTTSFSKVSSAPPTSQFIYTSTFTNRVNTTVVPSLPNPTPTSRPNPTTTSLPNDFKTTAPVHGSGFPLLRGYNFYFIFVIAGVSQVFIGLIFFALWLSSKEPTFYRPHRLRFYDTRARKNSHNRGKNWENFYDTCASISLGLLAMCVVGMETLYQTLLVTYLVTYDVMDVYSALYVLAAHYASYLAGRALGGGDASFTGPVPVLMFDVLGLLAAFVVQFLLGITITDVVWGVAIGSGFCLGSLLPSAVQHVEVTRPLNRQVAAGVLASAYVGASVMPAVTGHLMTLHGHVGFDVVLLVTSGACVFLLCVLLTFMNNLSSVIQQSIPKAILTELAMDPNENIIRRDDEEMGGRKKQKCVTDANGNVVEVVRGHGEVTGIHGKPYHMMGVVSLGTRGVIGRW